MNEITIPNDWSPRGYQLEFFRAMDSGIKRADLLWHRRAGKDSTVLNFTAKEMFKRVGNYWHLFPKQTQARKAIWNGIDGKGRKILKQVFPDEIRERTQGTEMMIELKNESTWQLCGSDNYDSLVGSNVVGVVFSEWSLCDPNAWNYIRPMLQENGGWAVFIYTARGKNHGYTLHNMASKNPKWFSQKLTIDDTRREDGKPVISQEILEDERNEGVGEDVIQQEYYCSFDAQIPGAVLADQMRKAYKEKRIIPNMPIDPSLPLGTSWDLGHRDSTVIWFWQATQGEIRLIHYYENNMKDLDHYIKYIKEYAEEHDLSYKLGKHLGPHDCDSMKLGQHETVQTQCRKAGINMIATERPATKAAGIQAVRKIFNRLWINETECTTGLACLSEYQYEWDDKLKMFKDNPLHNWASHGFDGLQTLALGWSESYKSGYKPMGAQKMSFNVNVF